MGDLKVSAGSDEELRRNFMRSLLEDVRALEYMLEADMIEADIRRIGAEQEMFLVDRGARPALISEAVLEALNDERFTYELGRFNLECNLTPQRLGGDCLRRMETELTECLAEARKAARRVDGEVLLTGILPTLHRSDLGLESMVPLPRYFELNRTLTQMRGSEFQLMIKGIDQLEIKHGNLMLEACNTSFQVHFQVSAREFAKLYNLAQAVAGPVLAAAVNSPILLGKRLWQETRIAVFENSVDARSDVHQARGHRPRVHFGEDWIKESVLEIFREDISRFRILLTADSEADPMAMAKAGKAPALNALRLHNGTVYRWNRAVYGISEGRPHLRIEHRSLPAGPTVIDEVANAAFFFGLMSGLGNEIDDIKTHLSFEEAKSNFFGAAREGLKAQLTWVHGEHQPARDLILGTLLPQAREGLKAQEIDEDDIERYLGVLEARVRGQRTGARWMLDSLAGMGRQGTLDERLHRLTAGMLRREVEGKPVHEWDKAEMDETVDWRESYRTVGQFMVRDLFTAQPDDLVDFAASLMEWEHIRHVPVEDDQGALVGLVSHRDLLRMVARGTADKGAVAVRDIMRKDPLTVTPETGTLELIRLMREHKVTCLPVVREGKLVGMVAERDLINVAAKLLEAALGESDNEPHNQ